MSVDYMNGLRTSANKDTDAGPSPAIWGNCPAWPNFRDPRTGYGFFDDFVGFHAITTAGKSGPWYGYIDTGNTIRLLATEVGGVAQLLTDATDNDGPVLGYGDSGSGGTGVAFKVVSGGKSLWFEARVRVSSDSLAENAIFVGLAEEARAVNDGLIVDDGAAMADVDYLGFFAPAHATAVVFDGGYVKSGGTDVIHASNCLTAVLATWYKLGFHFNAAEDTLQYYVDGVKVGTALDVSGAGTTHFPSGEELTAYICQKNGEAAIKKLDLDWMGCWQER